MTRRWTFVLLLNYAGNSKWSKAFQFFMLKTRTRCVKLQAPCKLVDFLCLPFEHLLLSHDFPTWAECAYLTTFVFYIGFLSYDRPALLSVCLLWCEMMLTLWNACTILNEKEFVSCKIFFPPGVLCPFYTTFGSLQTE